MFIIFVFFCFIRLYNELEFVTRQFTRGIKLFIPIFNSVHFYFTLLKEICVFSGLRKMFLDLMFARAKLIIILKYQFKFRKLIHFSK